MPRANNHLPGVRSKNLPERWQYNWNLKRIGVGQAERREKALHAETSMNKRLRPGVQGGKLSTVHSLAECFQANFLCLSLTFFLFKTEVKMRCSTLNKIVSRSKMGHRGKGAS